MFGGGRGAAAAEEGPEPGTDLEYQVNVPFWTAIRGGVMRLNITRQDVCSTCHGQGSFEAPGKCPECNGTGQITQTGGRMKFNVQCPRCHGTGKNLTMCPTCHGEGTSSKHRTAGSPNQGRDARWPAHTFAGERQCRSHGGTPGDLYVIIRTGDHPVFHRDGDDISLTVPVSATEAALGGKIEVPTIDGRALLKIPPGTQSGQKLRLREKGVPSATREGARGDEIVEITVTVPMPRDERTKELLRELAKLNPEDPRADLWTKVRSYASRSIVASAHAAGKRQFLRALHPLTPLPASLYSHKIPIPRKVHEKACVPGPAGAGVCALRLCE